MDTDEVPEGIPMLVPQTVRPQGRLRVDPLYMKIRVHRQQS